MYTIRECERTPHKCRGFTEQGLTASLDMNNNRCFLEKKPDALDSMSAFTIIHQTTGNNSAEFGIVCLDFYLLLSKLKLS